MSTMFGKCRLCLELGELQHSHLLPKSLYRLIGSATDPAHPDTVQITLNSRRKSSEQARRHILCARCEQRLNNSGERWVLHNCYRGRGRFRLRAELRKGRIVDSGSELEAYSASQEQATKLAYFCLSVIWRASVCDWFCRGERYQQIELGPHQEEIRRYLKGDTGIPKHLEVMVVLSGLEPPVLAMSFPGSYRLDSSHSYRFQIPGMTFVATVGGTESALAKDETSILRSPNSIFTNTAGDERVQEEIMKLMGKVAPPWGKYPLLNGVEKF